MADSMTAYEWLHVELSSVSGQLEEVSRRLKHEPRAARVREQERDILTRQLDQMVWLIEDTLLQARQEAYELYEAAKKEKKRKRRKQR